MVLLKWSGDPGGATSLACRPMLSICRRRPRNSRKGRKTAPKGNAVKDFFSPKNGVSVNWAI
jgi:hypothetical protein